MNYATLEDVIARVAALDMPRLVAIDGLPVSGKSTLADHLIERLGLQCIYLDDFIRPMADWPSRTRPAFPFEYIRYDGFLDAIRDLARDGVCAYAPFDWSTLSVSPDTRIVSLEKTVIIEGVSALNPAVAALYGLSIFVESDRSTTLAAALARGVGNWAPEWEQLFLPSADIYMRSRPQTRCDVIYAGRGAAFDMRSVD